jgi:exonuclease VII large subunit
VKTSWFGRVNLWICLAIVGWSVCSTFADVFRDLSVKYLEEAVEILANHAGNVDNAVAALDEYLTKNQQSIIEAKALGVVAMEQMSASQRSEFMKKSQEQTAALRERMNTLLQSYPKKAELMQRLKALW